MRIGSLQNGARGFDANGRVSPAQAREAVHLGYSFAVRYVRRAPVNLYDITAGELAGLLEAGLAVMLVQHVASENKWAPTPALGTQYGITAALESRRAGLPTGVSVWLDLEGIMPGVAAREVILYCNNWHAEVSAAGYRPGLYVGWHDVLTAEQLYRNLRFNSYWSAYNLNRDQGPIVRGVQMRQFAATLEDLVTGFTNQNFDVDVIHADALGGTPTLLLP